MKSLAGPCQYEETIKKSRFVAHAAPVKSQRETLEFYESVADPQASHNCWAWRIDYQHRSNDDGEPSGSAGRPILAMIEGRELEQVMVVVTRYWGGILLGIGGLVRAYGGCAGKCLDRAELLEWQPRIQCAVEIDFSLASSVHELLEQFEAEKLSEHFNPDGIHLKISLETSRYKAFEKALSDISRGQGRVRRLAGI